MVRWSRKSSSFSEHCHNTSGASGQVIECGKFYLFVMNVSGVSECFRDCGFVAVGFFPHIQCKFFLKSLRREVIKSSFSLTFEKAGWLLTAVTVLSACEKVDIQYLYGS